jgi:hypothetical protein
MKCTIKILFKKFIKQGFFHNTLKSWSQRTELNRRPTDYESVNDW